ncbi:helix-turn-helix transcriptional regulator [Streptosporangium vulgare]|uniref:Tetratricopeptide repeat protein n=1 Tax=Streptosporangium vulgare TaxID=46190 RepID=A0ABV5TMB8_9ACTN
MGDDLPRDWSGGPVGRDTELADLRRLLGSARLVTLTGAPGVGKTRLAHAYTRAWADAYPGGVWFRDLTAGFAGPAVPVVTASTGATAPWPPGPGLAELGVVPGEGPSLLVLDTCEHVADRCAVIVPELLGTHPGLGVLATSREPLGVPGEVTCRLAPLDLGLSARLFAERAAAQGRPATPETVDAVREICRRLDGLPLAVELAAARSIMLSPAQIAERLDDPLRLLAGGNRTAHPRHRSLEAAIGWSHEMLPGGERLLLRRLAVFEDGFVIDDVEGICAGAGIRPDSVVDLLAMLVSRSLVECDTSGAVTRYRLLRVVRAYARQELRAADEIETVRARHAEYYAALAERAAEALGTGAAAPHLERIEAAYANMRAVLRWCTSGGSTTVGARLASALETYWILRGRPREGRGWIASLVSSGDVDRAEVLAAAELSGAVLSCALGEYADASDACRRSLAMFRELGDEAGQTRALAVLAGLRTMGEPASAGPTLTELAARGRAPMGPMGHGWSGVPLVLLGRALLASGDLAGARAALERCVTVGRRRGSELSLEMGLLAMAQVAVYQGEYGEAESALGQSLAAADRMGDVWGRAAVLRGLGEVAACRGHYGPARERLAEAVAIARSADSPPLLGDCLDTLGRMLLDIGEYEAAREVFSEVVEVGERTAARLAAMGLAGLGAAILGSGGTSSGSSASSASSALTFAEEAMARARETDDRPLAWRCLFTLGNVTRRDDPSRAASAHHSALRAGAAMGLRAQTADSLEAMAGLAAGHRRHEHAARLFGAAQSLRDRLGLSRPPAVAPQHEADLAGVRAALGAGGFAALWEEGAGLDVGQAVTYAGRGRGPRGQGVGWAALTRAERQVALLASGGLTNREIGAKLFVSPRTVQAQLSSVFAKLGLSSRRDLAREYDSRARSLRGRDPGRDLGQDLGRDLGRDLGQDFGRDLGQDSALPAQRDDPGGVQDPEGGVTYLTGQLGG